jgi:hypothetical protein
VRLRGVVDHEQPMPLRERLHRLHVHRVAEQVHRNDGSRALGDEAFGRVEVEVPGHVLRVDRHRNRTLVYAGDRRGDVGRCADQHLVALADPGGREGELERGRAARDRDPVPRAHESGKGAFELRQRFAERA